jgi:hypothetical protein
VAENDAGVAQKPTVQFIDDLDGFQAEETVSFVLDVTSYEIGLSAVHVSGLREALSPYVVAARTRRRSVGCRGAGPGGRRAGSTAPRPASTGSAAPRSASRPASNMWDTLAVAGISSTVEAL